MNIQGVEILTQKIIYAPQWYGTIGFFFLAAITLALFFGWVEAIFDDWAVFTSAFLGIILLICTILLGINDAKTPLNFPNKIQCEIEIIDDNAWKEIGPNYKIIEKIYQNKEIYLIEGDYVND